MGQFCFRFHQRLRLIALVVVGLLGTNSSAAWAQIFVTNYNAGSITVYPRSSNGNIAPSYTILGQPGDGPHYVAIYHFASELIVTNFSSSSVAVYDRVSGALKRTITGESTGLNGPVAVAVDESNREIYVTNYWGNSITVYDIYAAGNASPKRTIHSGFFNGLAGLALDLMHDEIVVAVDGFNAIGTFDRLADGDSDPTRYIVGGTTGLNIPVGVGVDVVHDEILVANATLYSPNSGAILVFDRTANSATGDIAPKRRLEGSATGLCTPLSVAVDVVADEVVATNSNAASGGTCAQSVTTYSRMASGNTAPKRTITGGLTALNFPSSAAITSVSALNIKVKAVSSSVTAGDLVGYTITATAAGGPVWNVLLTDTLPAPTGMTWAMTSGSPGCTFSVSAGLLTCSADSLAKGQSITATISGKSTTSSCPGMVDQAAASYNDGTADVAGVSSQANINIKCK